MPNLSLAVEHGFNFRVGSSGEWQQLVENPDDTWRSVARSVMNVYCARTHGAFVQTKVLHQTPAGLNAWRAPLSHEHSLYSICRALSSIS